MATKTLFCRPSLLRLKEKTAHHDFYRILFHFENKKSLQSAPAHYLCRTIHSKAYCRYVDRTCLNRSLPGGLSTGTVAVLARGSGALGGWGQLVSRSKYRGQDSDDEESDDENGDGDEDFGTYFEGDEDFPDNFKELKKHITSLRADTILGGGLNLARKRVDDYFLSSKLLLNGQTVLKKSKQMAPGDCVDLVTEVTEDTIKVKRVRLVKVDEKKSSKDRHLAYLRAWRSSVTVARDKESKWSPR